MWRKYSWVCQLAPLALAAWGCIALANVPMLYRLGISPLTVAIVVGMLLGHTLFPLCANRLMQGVAFSKARLLRLGIVLYGFKLTLSQVAEVGWSAVLVDTVVVLGTFVLAVWLGRRMGLAGKMAALVGAGSAICGAAAVLATQPVLKSKDADVGVAVATVVVFGTLSMFLYPMAAAWVLSDASVAVWFSWGVYTGSTVHEVAQVAAAGAAVNDAVADVAVITKMIRVMMLAPFLLALPWLMRRLKAADVSDEGGSKVVIPWFAVWFMVMVGVNSVVSLPPVWSKAVLSVDTFLLTMAMLCLGLTTRWHTVREAGVKPLALAAILWVWLMVGGGLLSFATHFLFL